MKARTPWFCVIWCAESGFELGHGVGPIIKPTATMEKNLLHATIREAIVKAFEREAKKAEFKLSSRGHEPRVTLNRSMAELFR